jgi:hypothetical protein
MRKGAVGLVAVAALASTARAQTPRQAIQGEVRADAIVSRWTAVQGGVGVTFPAGLYVRTGGVIAAGGGGRGFDSRLDVFSRFNLDPFREKRWGLYGGGGISARYVERDDPSAHAYLLVFVGVEGPLHSASASGWVPAFEIGLGGGARVGIALRQGIPGRR